MQGIDKDELDQVIAQTYKNLAKALGTHSKGAIELHSQALHALVELRREVAGEGRGA